MYLNRIVIGGSEKGRGIHPWDNLKRCSCGGYPYMVGKDGKTFESGYPYKIYCFKCGKSTSNGSILDIRKKWDSF